MTTYTVTFYDITYGTYQRIEVEAKSASSAEWHAAQRCSISAGFRETLSVEEN